MNTSETAPPTSRRLRLLQHPIIRILLAAVFLAVGIVVTQLIIAFLGSLVAPQSPAVMLLSILVALLIVYGAYRIYVHLIEHRPLFELSMDRAGWELGAGLLVGAALFAVIIAILWLIGVYRISGWNGWLVLVPAFVSNIPSGFIQEVFFRGILFRIINESVGTWIAILVSAVLFGIIHLFTAHATLISTLTVAVEAGVLLAAAYLLTGRLWLAIGIHIAWDIANDGIFGVGAAGFTGDAIQGVLRATLVGPAILSGGENGIEASLVTFLLIGVVSVFLLRRAYQKGQWRPTPGSKKAK